MSWKKVAGIITAVLTFPYIKNLKVGLETKRERYSPYVAYEVPLKGDDSVSILRNVPGSYMENSFYRIAHLFFWRLPRVNGFAAIISIYSLSLFQFVTVCS